MRELFFLALAFARISLGSFAGGLSSIALIYHEIVLNYQWLTSGEFEQMISLAQMSPGPIAVNAATYVGKKIGWISRSRNRNCCYSCNPSHIIVDIAINHQNPSNWTNNQTKCKALASSWGSSTSNDEYSKIIFVNLEQADLSFVGTLGIFPVAKYADK